MLRAVLCYAVGLIFPVVLFVGILNNANETQPFLVFVVCIVLMTLAGVFATPGKVEGEKLKWVVWSAIVGVIEACALVFMV